MKTICKAMVTMLVILAFWVAACDEKRSGAAVATTGETANAKNNTMHSVKVGPPFQLKVYYQPVLADEPVPVRLEITSAQKLDQVEIEWTLPEGVSMVTGEMKKVLGPEKIAKGAKSLFDVKLKPGTGTSSQAVVTVKVMWQGQWYGAARAVNLKVDKAAEPAYKIAPGEGGGPGYIEMPMQPVK
jgi:hypothetical protein